MRENFPSPPLPQVSLKIQPGSILVLQLRLCNQMSETLVLRPTLEDWVVDDGQILNSANRLDPAYVYLVQGAEANQTLTIFMPFLLKPGQILKNWLRFPGIQEEAIPIDVKILSPGKIEAKRQVVEVSLPVVLPLVSPSVLDPAISGSFNLIAGLIDLDRIPSRWLVAELLVKLCQIGNEYAQTASGRQLLNQLQLTSFFGNGAIALESIHIFNWISDSLSKTNLDLESQMQPGHLLQFWQRWLLSLAPTEEKVSQTPEMLVASGETETAIAQLGKSGQSWFAGIVLGLARLSPRIADRLKAIATPNFSQDKSAAQARESLLASLSSLDLLPARWLAGELLLILCQQGNQYAQTEAGSQWLKQLSHTRFYQNGVLAFTSAQVPRWLVLSQAAAAAYQASVASGIGQGGLLELGERWLWSLSPISLNFGHFQGDTFPSTPSVDASIAALGLDAERWFARVILGLAWVCPSIAATLKMMPQASTSSISTASSGMIFENALEQGGTLQQ